MKTELRATVGGKSRFGTVIAECYLKLYGHADDEKG